MKKSIVLVCILVLLVAATGCNSLEDYGKYVIGKTFIYQDEGYGGDFFIDINEDGTYHCCEGHCSSDYETGIWAVVGKELLLGNDESENRFEISKGKLTWRQEGSSGFYFAHVLDGEVFTED